MDTANSALSLWIKQRRRALDMTQENLAERAGCSVVTIHKIERGERRPSRQVALKLAECLRVPPGERVEFVRFARGEVGAFGLAPSGGHRANGGARPRGSLSSNGHSGSAIPGNTTHPTNLPSSLTRLLGREEAVAGARRYLLRRDVRLLTFTGAPGIGKTRLSMQVAADLLPHFDDGVFFVELGPISDPPRVITAIAVTLGLAENGSGSTLNDVKQFLTGKSVLLVLDNFEHLLEAAPEVVDLLSCCPDVKALVTSREALRVLGEQQFPVAPLDVPDVARLPGVEALRAYPAIALFLERARAVDPAFQLDEANVLDVATICARLDGLPLAIELAAARVRLLSPAEMSARLDRQLNLLANPARYLHTGQLPARQQTMRAAIEWSYQLLDEREQTLFSRLGVFLGGWTLQAAETVCGPGLADGMQSLLEKSLLKREDGSDGRRFTMLELIREYARDVLEERGEAEELRRRHAHYFLDLAERAEPYLVREEQSEWFRRLEQEHSNVRAAICWALARREDDIVLRFGAALNTFLNNRYPGEGRAWVEGALNGALKGEGSRPSLTRARALYSAGLVLRKTREYPQARAMIEQSLREYRAIGYPLGMAISLRWMANLVSEMNLPGERGLAGKLYAESLEIFHAIGDRLGIAYVLACLGEEARAERDYPSAIAYCERSLAILRDIKDTHGIADVATNLAYVLYNCGEYERARALLGESLSIYRQVASAFSAAWALVGWAGIERAQGDAHKAATLIGAANLLAASGGALFDPNDQRDREEIEAAVRADLSEHEWGKAQERGRTMKMGEAIEYALGQS